MPHIFCTDNPQVNTSDDPRHIIIYRNRNTAESVRDQTPPSGRRMCSFIPCFPHFRGILFIHQFYFYILFMLLQEHHRPLLHLFMMSAVSHHNDTDVVCVKNPLHFFFKIFCLDNFFSCETPIFMDNSHTGFYWTGIKSKYHETSLSTSISIKSGPSE